MARLPGPTWPGALDDLGAAPLPSSEQSRQALYFWLNLWPKGQLVAKRAGVRHFWPQVHRSATRSGGNWLQKALSLPKVWPDNTFGYKFTFPQRDPGEM